MCIFTWPWTNESCSQQCLRLWLVLHRCGLGESIYRRNGRRPPWGKESNPESGARDAETISSNWQSSLSDPARRQVVGLKSFIFCNVESSIPLLNFNTCLLWKPACRASNLSFFLLHFPPFVPCAQAVFYQKPDRGWAIDTSWHTAAWSIFFIHLDIFVAKRKQGLGTLSIHLGFH